MEDHPTIRYQQPFDGQYAQPVPAFTKGFKERFRNAQPAGAFPVGWFQTHKILPIIPKVSLHNAIARQENIVRYLPIFPTYIIRSGKYFNGNLSRVLRIVCQKGKKVFRQL
jgi:hypothetical protein